jgi:hypothetical protein
MGNCCSGDPTGKEGELNMQRDIRNGGGFARGSHPRTHNDVAYAKRTQKDVLQMIVKI